MGTYQQVSLQTIYLADVLLKKAVSRHPLVDLGLVADRFGTKGVVESREGFFHIGLGGRDGSDDTGLGASTERILKEPSEFRFAVDNLPIG